MSVSHKPITITTITFSLFQMATLPRFLERLALGGRSECVGDVHTKHNQQCRGNKGKVSKELEKEEWVLGVTTWAHKTRRSRLQK
jgi:hypothetical protein